MNSSAKHSILLDIGESPSKRVFNCAYGIDPEIVLLSTSFYYCMQPSLIAFAFFF